MISKQLSWTYTKKKRNFLKFNILFAAFLALFLVSCSGSSLNYKPSAELRNNYDYMSVSEHFKAYYNVQKVGDKTIVRGVLMNVSKSFASNVKFNFDECCKSGGYYDAKTYEDVSLGNIKNFSHKPFQIIIESPETKEVTVNYEFTPSEEDSFIKPGAETPAYMFEPIKGKISLIISK